MSIAVTTGFESIELGSGHGRQFPDGFHLLIMMRRCHGAGPMVFLGGDWIRRCCRGE